MSSARNYFVDISFDPVSDSVQIAAVFGPLSSAVDWLKLILFLAKNAQECTTRTSTQSQALSSILRECQLALTTTYLRNSQKDS